MGVKWIMVKCRIRVLRHFDPLRAHFDPLRGHFNVPRNVEFVVWATLIHFAPISIHFNAPKSTIQGSHAVSINEHLSVQYAKDPVIVKDHFSSPP